MKGIWVAVKATTSVSGSSRNTVLKLWKSRPAAPMMITRRFGMADPSFPHGVSGRGCGRRREWCDARGGAVRRPGGDEERREIGRAQRLNSSHANISYAVFCLKKKTLFPLIVT